MLVVLVGYAPRHLHHWCFIRLLSVIINFLSVVGIVLGIILLIVISVLVFIVAVVWCKHKKTDRQENDYVEPSNLAVAAPQIKTQENPAYEKVELNDCVAYKTSHEDYY